jgi:hypothetical protein
VRSALRCTTAGNLPVRLSQHFLGGVAVTGLVLGCAWTVYTNVLRCQRLSIREQRRFEAPVVKNPTVAAARPVQPAFNEIFASLPQQSLVSPAPENVASSLMFNERFAAAAAQGEPSRAIAPNRSKRRSWRKLRRRPKRRRRSGVEVC